MKEEVREANTISYIISYKTTLRVLGITLR